MPDPTAVDTTTAAADGLRALASFFWHLSRQGTQGPETVSPATGNEPPRTAEDCGSESPVGEAAWLRQLAGAVIPRLQQEELQRLTEELREWTPPEALTDSPGSVRIVEQPA